MVRFEATSTGARAPAPQNRNPPAAVTPLLSISKPSWVVKSESNIRKERITKPDKPCVVCRGSGRVDCSDCGGRELQKLHVRGKNKTHPRGSRLVLSLMVQMLQKALPTARQQRGQFRMQRRRQHNS